MTKGDFYAQPGGVDPVSDAIVAGGFYGGRWLLRRLRAKAQGSTDPQTLPMAKQVSEGDVSNVRLVEPPS